MIRSPRLMVAVLVAIPLIMGFLLVRSLGGGGGPAGAGGGGAGDRDALAALVARQVALAARGDWLGVYAATSPAFRAACPFEAYVAAMTRGRGGEPAALELADLRVRVDGDEGTATYRILAGGQVAGEATAAQPDRFVRVGGVWYDEEDPAICAGR